MTSGSLAVNRPSRHHPAPRGCRMGGRDRLRTSRRCPTTPRCSGRWRTRFWGRTSSALKASECSPFWTDAAGDLAPGSAHLTGSEDDRLELSRSVGVPKRPVPRKSWRRSSPGRVVAARDGPAGFPALLERGACDVHDRRSFCSSAGNYAAGGSFGRLTYRAPGVAESIVRAKCRHSA